MNDLVRALPYHLPRTTPAALSALADVMSVSRGLVARGDRELLALMAGVILYRHLPSNAKRDVMERLQAYSRSQTAWRRNLYHPLLGRVLDTMVDPEWGLWSMSNEELHAGLRSIIRMSDLLSASGLSGSVGGFMVQCGRWLYKTGRQESLFGIAIGVVFMGLAWGLDGTEQRYREELRRRMTEHSSIYYR